MENEQTVFNPIVSFWTYISISENSGLFYDARFMANEKYTDEFLEVEQIGLF